MSKPYPHLLAPLKIRGKVLKNRMCMSRAFPSFAMGNDSFMPLESVVAYARHMAQNGAAMIICPSANFPNPHSRDFPEGFGRRMIPVLDRDDGLNHFPIPGELDGVDLTIANARVIYSRMVEAIHNEGALASISMMEIEPMGWGFTDIPKEYLDELTAAFLQKCRLYEGLGFDAFCFYMSNGNTLLAQSISPAGNRREDEYGGATMAERARYSLELFRKVRKACPDMLIEVQITGEEPGPGYKIDDLVEYARLAEGIVDIFHVRDMFGKDSVPFFNRDVAEPETLAYAAKLKASGVNIAVAPVGNFQDPAANERYIAEGKADFIYMARAFMCDSEYGKKVAEGRAEDITPCLQCNKCHCAPGDPNAGCSVNPRLILSVTDPQKAEIRPAAVAKKIAVVGGGPAGMEAAYIAALRGHRVTLFEKNSVLGGQLLHADHAPIKYRIKKFKDHLIRMTEQSGVEIRLQTEATPEGIRAEGFDAVIAAAGAIPRTPGIDGEESIRFWLPTDVYGREKELGAAVAVVGGSETAVETGMYLAEAGHRVTLLSRQPFIAMNAQGIHYRDYFEELWEEEKNFSYITEARTLKLTETGVVYADREGREHLLTADDIVLCGGVEPQTDAAMAFADAADGFFIIGDCREAGDILMSMKTAYTTAIRI